MGLLHSTAPLSLLAGGNLHVTLVTKLCKRGLPLTWSGWQVMSSMSFVITTQNRRLKYLKRMTGRFTENAYSRNKKVSFSLDYMCLWVHKGTLCGNV